MRRTIPEHAEQHRAALRVLKELQSRLASNVRRLREQHGWKQEEAAWRCAMGVRMFQKVEAGKGVNATFATISRLCAAFDVDATELLAAAPPPLKRSPGRPKKPSPVRTPRR
jgi:transcriptional regulator with XRE-family HTH domain